MNQSVGVSTYHNIRACDFDKAKKFVEMEMAKLSHMPSARIKDKNWRNKRLGQIHKICKEKGWEIWRKEFIKKKFNADSMTEMTNDELESLYTTIVNKR